ncbi:high affinity immunoglobulin epsilon receptor subunit alpha [Camelus dromedarius]|uniref:high affinity immunoglobulin epsilon receptor subunit alpha n=1 Tax=Camelus ferus TaxID=419612 RepID=UPI0010DB7FA7|nr:high affinity immunoglobulin epsilon receptor subunit alpha [Camelus ferus]XP_010953915.2 high affinity immunoglobulin epsilon receptor subunit alpha [Camelus bactrianus]
MGKMPPPMGVPALLWMVLLLFSSDGMSAAIWKSTVSLNPPWTRIFRGENVLLTCTVNNSLEDGPITWTHNKTTLPKTTSSWDIIDAKAEDSGQYRCKSQKRTISEPVYLEVISDWLLLQASAEVVTKGESLLLRCLGWRNRDVYKVIYYKDGEALQYWYENYNFSIVNATTEDSGTYYCKGTVWKIRYISNALNITVKDRLTDDQSNHLLQFLIPLLVVILFAVDTGLLISTQRQFTFLLKMKRTRKGNKFMGT